MKKIYFLFLLLCISLSARANDTAGYVLPTGGVVFEKQDGIKMKTEALYIRPGQIEVNYLFENTTDKDITTQVFFPLQRHHHPGFLPPAAYCGGSGLLWIYPGSITPVSFQIVGKWKA